MCNINYCFYTEIYNHSLRLDNKQISLRQFILLNSTYLSFP